MGFSLKKLGSKIFDQANPFDNGRTYQQRRPTNNRSVLGQATHNGLTNVVGRQPQNFVNNVSVPVERRITNSPIGRGAETIALGGLRSFTGTAQGLSGLYDLATPGVGTNRFSKNLDKYAKNIDATVKAEKLNSGLYKGSQLGTDLLTFMTPGAFAKGTSMAGKVGVANKATSGFVKAKTAGLASKGFGGRVASKSLQNAVKPGYQGANAGYTGLQLGKEASTGKDISPERVATDLTIGGVAFPVVGAVGKEGLSAVAGKIPAALKPQQAPKVLLKKREKAVDGYNRALDNGKKVAADAYTKEIQGIDKQITKAKRPPILQRSPLTQQGSLGSSDQPTIKNVFGEEVPNPAYNPSIPAEPTTVYHGTTPENINSIKAKGLNAKRGRYGSKGDVAYVSTSDNPLLAKYFGDSVVGVKTDGMKFLDLKDYASPKYIGKLNDVPENIRPYIAEVQAQQQGELGLGNAKLNKYLKDNGYDGIKLSTADSKGKQGVSYGTEYRFANNVPPERIVGVDNTPIEKFNEKFQFPAQPTQGAIQKPKVTQKAKQAQPAPKVSQKTVDSLPNNNIDDQLQKVILGNADVNYSQGVLGQLGEKLSPNRQIRKVTGAVETGINKVLRGSLESGSRTVRTPGRVAAGVSRQSGKTAEELAQYGRLQGGKQLGDELAIKVAKTGEEAVQGGVRPDRVAAILDPELTKATIGKLPDVTPNEAAEAARLRKIINLTHEGEYAIGLLDEKAYKANKGTYFPRNFDAFFDNDVTRQIAKHNKLDLNIFKQRSELADIPKEVLEKANKDPYYMTALRVQQYAKNKAVVDHTKWLAQNGSILDAPKKGYIQVPDSPAYGAIKGKYVLKEQLEDLQGFIYETDTAQHIMALLNTYDRNPARQFLKKTKTVYNPGVRLGNRTFNYLTAGINGINPITYTKNWARASKMMHKQSPEFLEATREGVFGSSIIDKELYQVSDALTPVKGNAATKGVRTADNFISNTYRGVDDKGKMATYLTFRERGLSPADAAERTRRAMQNYDMVGHFFDQGAKTPIGGNAFVRFSSELMRIAHNSAVDNPLRLAGAVASVVALTNMASQLSGESPEDRRTREGRLGAPRVPFTNQSLEVQTPYGAINIGRLLGITTYNDLVGGVAEDSKRLMPFQPPVTNTPDGVKFNPNFITSDPLVGGIVGQAIDKDFRGKSIKDPENSGQFQEPLSTKSQLANRAQTAAMGYIPLANEANSLYSAVRGQENFYGKKRSPVQAGLRVAGIKVEQYGPEQAKKQRATDEYFKEKAKLDKEVATLPKRDQEAYKRATGYYKLREQVDNEFSPGDKRYKKDAVYNFPEDKWKEYTTSPKLYEMIKKDKERKFKKQGQPIQPEFDNRLSNEFRKQLINNKSQAPGEDVEADQRLYTSSEWDLYEQIKKEYSTAASKYYPARKDGTFTDELVKRQNAPFPNKPPAKKAYDDAYAAYAKGQGPKPQYNDAVDAAKQQYSDAKFKWTNDERKARGLPPLSKEVWDNVTFGFESDEEKVYKQLKYGKGYGGYGSSSGGSSGSKGFDPYEYAVSLGSNKTPKPKVYQAKQRKIAKAKISKPKVTIKKSKV